ncbi:MAG: hypothetical protein WDZ35_07100 [Crocinitomicaceae bacterium]
MLKHLFLSILMICSLQLHAQKLVLYGDIVDVEGDPVKGVKVFLSKTPKTYVLSDKNGRFYLSYQKDASDSLKFQTIKFAPYSTIISKRMEKRALRKNDSIYFEIVMPDRMFDIFEVRPNTPDTLFGTQEYSVEDFSFLPDGRMILLTYEKTLKKGAVLRLLDSNQTVINKYYVLGDAVELTEDYRGNIHLIGEERIYLIRVVRDHIRALQESREYYFKYVAPIIDTIGSNIYFSNFSEIYPAFDYLEFDREDSSYSTILQVEDSSMMEFYRAEFKYVDVRTKIWAHQKQIETGIDKEVWVGATVFTNSIYYRPVYAPLFKTGEDTLVIFDHYKNKMFRYTPEEGFIDSTRISYHLHARRSGWEQPLLHDKVRGNVYALFEKGGYTYLSEIDKEKGIVKQSFKLHFKYVERIQIVDGKVFYIYRPFESIQKKYIYREKLS